MQRNMKRRRSQNWVDEDKVILKNLIKERIHIIANKNTDFSTNKLKEKAWDDLLKCFNQVCIGTTRTVPQVKAQWGFMKMHANKMRDQKRKWLTKTDVAGVPKQPESKDIPIWLPIQVKIETSDDPDTITMEDAPELPGTSSVNENKEENSMEMKFDNPATSTVEENSNDEWLCERNENGINFGAKASTSDGANNKKTSKKTAVASPAAQSPAAQVAAVEIECRRELHAAQMKVAKLQADNEQFKSKLLQMEELFLTTKYNYYKEKTRPINIGDDSE